VATKFYTFSQNNSGGFFNNDHASAVAEYVIIEAKSAIAANAKAKDIGIYFDGCKFGIDCSCCGDRWYSVDEYDAKEAPTVYGTPVTEWVTGESSGYVHYLDGTVRGFVFVL
jgi:hypothetical protein